ncbi:MAG: molybdopterin-guanine dinucleotide biosynthesis protein MobA [Actinobacteria bacterium]|nr:MAG: molybdopterin-guanine dinucleotide biosynthesis protein MobA [Actinomycetota bacterium]
MLAGGAGKRFGGPKAPALVDGERLVDRSVRILREAGCAPIVVVLGAWIDEVPGAIPVVNANWQEGMGSSLRTGLEYLLNTPATNALITLVDLPGLTALGCARIVSSSAGVAAATFQGERGHPVKFSREHWADIIDSAHGDQGARAYLLGRDDIELIEIADVASGDDLDFKIE